MYKAKIEDCNLPVNHTESLSLSPLQRRVGLHACSNARCAKAPLIVVVQVQVTCPSRRISMYLVCLLAYLLIIEDFFNVSWL